MKNNIITINGTPYPCRLTLGAVKTFKEQTGKELADIGADMVLLGTLIYITTSKSCQKERKTLPWQSAEELLEDIELTDMPSMVEELFGKQPDKESETKKNEVRE